MTVRKEKKDGLCENSPDFWSACCPVYGKSTNVRTKRKFQASTHFKDFWDAKGPSALGSITQRALFELLV